MHPAQPAKSCSPAYCLSMFLDKVESKLSLGTNLKKSFNHPTFQPAAQTYSATGFESKMACFWCFCVFWLVFCELQVVAG